MKNKMHFLYSKMRNTYLILNPHFGGCGGFRLLLFSFLLFSSCHKPGPGGSATIKGIVMHQSKSIKGSVVYIKYGATQSPGADVTYYDESVTTDAQANYQFQNLRRGDYFLFAVGFDSAAVQSVSGGIHIEIKSKTETAQQDVTVN